MSTIGRAVINKIPEVTSNPLGDKKIELVVPKDRIRDVIAIIDEELENAMPESVFGIDLENDKYELIYLFWSFTSQTLVQLRVALEGEKPEIESTCDIFPGLEWHEREVREMFGIEFKNHPDPRLFLLPDELDGAFPMRKRFKTDMSRLQETGITPPKPRPKPGGEGK
ncbi:MAG: NADH-quinone oxidoreductase subunit C [Candidatus Thorarchaeota archaeon]